MDRAQLYHEIVTRFLALPGIADAVKGRVTICAKSLSPEEAIGRTERTDYPILTGNDVMIEARYHGARGQAFTDAPSDYSGTLGEILEMPFATDAHARGLLIASINAVMGSLGLCDRMVHCKDGGPKRCGQAVAAYVRAHYGNPRILMIGYQPSIIENLTKNCTQVQALDLNEDNIGQSRFGIIIGNGGNADVRTAAIQHADLILCTGSTVCNGTLTDYLDTGTETLFYGTTLAGVATLLHLPRLCFAE